MEAWIVTPRTDLRAAAAKSSPYTSSIKKLGTRPALSSPFNFSAGVLGLVLFAVLAAGGLKCPSVSCAGGYSVYTHGARELARANAVVASPEGPTSAFFNPATMTAFSESMVEAGTILISPSKEFTSAATGRTVEAERDLFSPSTLFALVPLSDKVTVGCGVNSPFGLGTEWPSDWEGRYLSTKGEMQTYLLNPNMAFKVTDTFTIAGGVDFLSAEVSLGNKIPLFAMGLPDGAQEFKADGNAWGYNMGMYWELPHGVSIGAAYRSAMEIDFAGDLRFDLPPGTPALVAAGFSDTTGHAELPFPAQAFAGVSWRVTDKCIVEVGARWEEWSAYENLTMFFDSPVAGKTVSTIKKDWSDNYAFNVGGKYSVNACLDILFGYLYDGTPVPDDTFEPSISDAEKHLLSVGLAGRGGGFSWCVTYLYQRYDDRDKNNTVGTATGFPAQGTYEQETHMLGLSIGYTF